MLAYYLPDTANYSVFQIYSKTPWPCFVNPDGIGALGLEVPKREKKRKSFKRNIGADSSANVSASASDAAGHEGAAGDVVSAAVPPNEPFRPARFWALGRVAVNDTCAVKKVHTSTNRPRFRFILLLSCGYKIYLYSV